MKILKRIALLFLALLFFALAWFFYVIQIPEPQVNIPHYNENDVVKIAEDYYVYQDAWLRKNQWGLWEMYISGSPEELGIKNGILAKGLIRKQEEAFITQIKRMIPSESYLKFLKYVTSFMNHNLPDYIPLEYQKEIKALSLFASDDFQFIGDNYARQLNYHAAHDIGHAMQNLHLVECTAFGVLGNKSSDSSLLIGRNFDFYVGDEFAENKIVLFVKPDHGLAFSSITWGGMIGVVSGMNEAGLSITLNSAKSEIPLFAKTPVSIIAREVLQYADNIQDAYEIIARHPSFVAESFFVSSAKDQNFAVVEKTPDTTILYQPNKPDLLLTNHFQSEGLSQTEINLENIEENVTQYRFERLEQLLNRKEYFTYLDFADILRDTRGINDQNIGLGNEGAINQLIAHHSIIFKPEQKRFWISTQPYQLGTYVSYQLDSIFDQNKTEIAFDYIDSLNIPSDSAFLNSDFLEWEKFVFYRKQIEDSKAIDIEQFILSNPEYFFTYELAGDYCVNKGDYQKAFDYYQIALKKMIPNQHEENRILQKISHILEEQPRAISIPE